MLLSLHQPARHIPDELILILNSSYYSEAVSFHNLSQIDKFEPWLVRVVIIELISKC